MSGEIFAILAVGLIIFVIVLIFAVPIMICQKIANHKLKKDKEKEEEEKEKIKNGSGNFETATIIEKEVKRPFMRALATIAKPIFIIFIINCICFNVLYFWEVFEEKYEIQEAAKKVTDEEWEMYENYLDEDGEKLSTDRKEEIKEWVKNYKKNFGGNKELTYYGYGSYDEWNEEFCSSYIRKYQKSLGEDSFIVNVVLISIALGSGVIWYVSKKAYEIGQGG